MQRAQGYARRCAARTHRLRCCQQLSAGIGSVEIEFGADTHALISLSRCAYCIRQSVNAPNDLLTRIHPGTHTYVNNSTHVPASAVSIVLLWVGCTVLAALSTVYLSLCSSSVPTSRVRSAAYTFGTL